MMHRKGLSLIEIILAIAIILLIAALLIPVIARTRQDAKKSSCINNLRQIGQAIEMYRSDHEGIFPERMQSLASYAKSRDIFICPSDTTLGRGIIATIEGLPTRYQTILSALSKASRGDTSEPEARAAKILLERDPNHGIALCFLHGRRETQSADPVLGDYMGLILRLQVDSSVRAVNLEWVCTSTRPGVVDGHLPGWFAFSDVRPCPAEVPPDAGLLACPPTQNVVPCP